jgi:hypothetical protein
MKKLIKSKLGKFFLCMLLCVFVFAVTNFICGWLVRDYNWLYRDIRPAILLFIALNVLIDFPFIVYIKYEIDCMY